MSHAVVPPSSFPCYNVEEGSMEDSVAFVLQNFAELLNCVCRYTCTVNILPHRYIRIPTGEGAEGM